MYQRILVPIDGSATASRGLSEALRLAQTLKAQLQIIHVINELPLLTALDQLIDPGDLVDALREVGQTLLQRASDKAHAAGVKAQTHLIEAHGKQAGVLIIDQALTEQADLLVLGTHGRRGLARLVLGSDAEYVVRHATIPVLLVRHSE